MFGLLEDDAAWSRGRLGRFAGRSFRDVDWGQAITASINLTTGIVGAVSRATSGQSQQNQPATYQCPQGYVYDGTVGTCREVQSSNSGGGFDLGSIPPMALAAGGLVLVLLLTQKGS